MKGVFSAKIPAGIWLALALLLLALGWRAWIMRDQPEQLTAIVILAPDGMDASEPSLAIWLDAAREEGLPVELVHLSELLGHDVWGRASRRYAAMILPDGILRYRDHRLLAPLQSFVEQGGWLFVTYDALTRRGRGDEDEKQALLSPLVGVEYARFESLKEKVTAVGAAMGSQEDMTLLQIPPGKAIPWKDDAVLLALTTYQYGFLNYPHFVTEGEYPGRALLKAPDGSLLLGERKLGQGGVLFANLPLGSLKGRTDGLLLHAALRYFAVNLLGLPTLMSSPDGIGGLVFNWHLDSNTAVAAVEELDRRGLLQQGPFSIHFTAGPDAYRTGDRAGMDLAHNQAMQRWIARFQARGDALGNHGGWIHDYFGLNASDDNEEEMKSLLTLNDDAVRAQAGHPLLEYSAPVGNQPEWVTRWIEQRGVLAYYFTGNTGMSPTRSYRDGRLQARKIWSFPILTLNQIASFEEAAEENMPEDYLRQWLVSIAEFTADTGSVKTFYSHAPGWHFYFGAIETWFARTSELLAEKRFRWYTMTRMAEFLNRREQVNWKLVREDGGERLIASQPQSLGEMTWRLPKQRYQRPETENGQTRIRELDDAWLVTAEAGKSLNCRLTVRTGATSWP